MLPAEALVNARPGFKVPEGTARDLGDLGDGEDNVRSIVPIVPQVANDPCSPQGLILLFCI